MATLDSNRLKISRWMVDNHLRTNDIFKPGTTEKREVKTKQDLVNEYGAIFEQFGKARHGNRFDMVHMSGDRIRPEDPGSGGPLLALLDELRKHNPKAALEAAMELHNNGHQVGRITVESGAVYEIPKSPCSTSDFTDFAGHRGLWAGQQ
jgi:hypothetical protein